MAEAHQAARNASAFGVLRLWTFGSCDLLIEVMRRFGVESWKEVEDFSTSAVSRHKKKRFCDLEPDRRFASILASAAVDSTSGATVEATLEVSPFDARFPVIDWRAELSRERKQRRRSVGSRISARYLRDVHEYPSALTIHFSTPSSQHELGVVFRAFCASIPSVLEGIPAIAGVGLVSDGGYVLPPDSLASRIEQTIELRAKVDRDYPVVYLPATRLAEAASTGLWMADDILNCDAGRFRLPDEIRIQQLSDRDYREFRIKRGIFETGDGALILGDRQGHKLNAAALACFESTDRMLCPLTNPALNLALGLAPAKRPFLLVSLERCRWLSACVSLYSASLRSDLDRKRVAEGLISALTTCDQGIGPEVARVLCELTR